MEELEEAQQVKDLKGRRRAEAVPAEEWSPSTTPYKVFEKHAADDDDSEEDDEEEAQEGQSGKAELKAAAAEIADGGDLEVGMDDEVGFTYRGPEPTLYGDWAHKGRCTDF
eukprot:CAMPEP_0168711534 /NCGR_PEP_ID=MMETSP0503-20121227/43201_1 /TAXON_ID=89963 /ORGANISM="Heterocapsa rotundata, Strain SCCAP K-0483" /LENGTH=110 /DNA_ID=CAMNT_0008757897 /DNA_START=24 /DNA_END=356 /DNA_ORIENTATION=-